MRINHNISALNTYRQLNANNKATSSSLENLSSGLRINRAGDDAAGLAISEKMRGQIRGLDQASSNANDGISLIQTAEGALNETHSILQRMRELAVQSANDTNTDADRIEIQKEIDQLTAEITRISTDTQFNTKNLINGDMQASAQINRNEISEAQMKNVSVAAGATIGSGTYKVTISEYTPAQEERPASNVEVSGPYTGRVENTYSYLAADIDTGAREGWYDVNGKEMTVSEFAKVGLTLSGNAEPGAVIKVTPEETKLGQGGEATLMGVGGTNSKGMTAVMDNSIVNTAYGNTSATDTEYDAYGALFTAASSTAPAEIEYGENVKTKYVQFRYDEGGQWDAYVSDDNETWTASTANVSLSSYGITTYGEAFKAADATAASNGECTCINVKVTGNIKPNPNSVAAVDPSITTSTSNTTVEATAASVAKTDSLTNHPTIDNDKVLAAFADYVPEASPAGAAATTKTIIFTYGAGDKWTASGSAGYSASNLTASDLADFGITLGAMTGGDEGENITLTLSSAVMAPTEHMSVDQDAILGALKEADAMPATVNAGQSQNITEVTVTATGSGATARYTATAGDTVIASNLSADKLNEKLGLTFSGTANIHDGDTFSFKVLGGSSSADDKISAKIDITQSDAVEAKDAEYKTVIKDAKGNLVSSSSFDFEFGEKFGFDVDGYPQSVTTFDVMVDASKALVFHIGANSGQNTTLNMNNMNAESLGIDKLNLTTQKGADSAITTIDNAITTVSAQRAALGAMQNRLEHTINNLSTTSENLTASESQIRDVDMAKEMTSFTKNNILVQAAQSMLAQANQQPQGVLQLLQG